MNRRSFLRDSATAGLVLAAFPGLAGTLRSAADFPPVRRLTNGPKHHWFGYYDKWQVDPTNRYVLGMQVEFEHRTPRPDDVIKIGMVDLQDNDRWIELGESRAWGWQQGCMLQWLPGSKDEIIWNDRVGEAFVAHVLHVPTRQRRTLPKAVYTLSPNGQWALGLDFARLQNLRPGYGYVGLDDRYKDQLAPEKTGIYRLDLKTGKDTLLIPYAQCARLPHKGMDVRDNWHWYNHLLVSPDSQRFIFLNRWRKEYVMVPGREWTTRMFTADKNGKDLFVLDPDGHTSHFIWRDPQHVCAWTKPAGHPAGFYLFKDNTRQVEPVGPGVMTVNGHNTYLPIQHNSWILNDTYAHENSRQQTLYLYHVPTNRRIDLGHFHSPKVYGGEWRCDLHPRYSPDGKMAIIDSTHEGLGRQLYLVDISGIVG